MEKPYTEETDTGEDEKETKAVQRRGALIELSQKDRKSVAKKIQKNVETWKETSSEHHSNLRRWNDLLENVIEETDFPWEGASQLHIPLVAIHLNTLKSVIARSITTVDPLWYSKTIESGLRDLSAKVEEFANYKAKFELNIVGATRDVIWTTGRDGIGWHYVPYVDEYETYSDIEIVESEEDFIKAFPDAESAGMTEEEYQAKLEEVRANASEENPMEIEVTVDRCIYRGPKAIVVDESDMVRVPMTATELRKCKLHGRRFYMCSEELKDRVEEGALWKDSVDALLKDKKGSGNNDSSWRDAQNKIEGITSDSSRSADEYEIIEGFVKLCLDESGKKKKYFFTYCSSHDALLGLSENIYRKEIFIPYRFIKRSGRMLGKSIPELLEDMNYHMDLDIRQEQNNDTIRNVPIFIGQKSEKTTGFDPQRDENVVRPGVFWWLEKPENVKVLNKQDGSNRDSVERRKELMQMSEMLVGPTQMLSGRESPIDPNAPGNKTIALIQQSNMRIEDYINEFRGGIENGDGDAGFDALGDLIISHYYQFGNPEHEFISTKDGNVISSLRRKELRGNFHMGTHGVTAQMNPEIEFGKAMMWFQILSKDQMVTSDPMRYRSLLKRLMVSGRFEGMEELLPSTEEVQGLKDKALMQKAEESVMKKLQAQGVFPAPQMAQPGLPPALGAPPIQGGSNLPPSPMVGAPAGAVGLPPMNNLPPPM